MTQSRHKFKVCRRSLSNRYDHLDRRVQKITPAATMRLRATGEIIFSVEAMHTCSAEAGEPKVADAEGVFRRHAKRR